MKMKQTKTKRRMDGDAGDEEGELEEEDKPPRPRWFVRTGAFGLGLPTPTEPVMKFPERSRLVRPAGHLPTSGATASATFTVGGTST